MSMTYDSNNEVFISTASEDPILDHLYWTTLLYKGTCPIDFHVVYPLIASP